MAIEDFTFFALWHGVLDIRIQPTPALRRVVRGDYLRYMSYPLQPAHFMQGLLACNGAYELG